jgi:hypothetical protein
VLKQRYCSRGAHQYRPRSSELDLGGHNVQERRRLPLPSVSILSLLQTQYIQLTILAASSPLSLLSSLSSFSLPFQVGMRSATLALAPTSTSSLSLHDLCRKLLSRSFSLPQSSFSYRSCGNTQHRWLQHRLLRISETAV